MRGTMRRAAVQGFLLAFLLLLLSAVCASYHYRIPRDLWEELMPVPEGERVDVSVEPGINARQIAAAFEEAGALEGSAKELAVWMARFGLDRKMRPGLYSVVRSEPWYVARQLRGMRPAVHRMTLIPGADICSLHDAFSADVTADGSSALSEAVMDDANYPAAMRKKLPADEEARLAFLQPETYVVPEETPRELVRAASALWWKNCGTSADALTSADLRERAVIASMVEREVLHNSESRRVSGVIHRRLDKKILLQIDATVVYAWKLKGKRLTRVLNSDLAIDSPYNTYRIPGLPPGPICVPGLAAWDAAFEPEEGSDYYYVARRDGYHYFGKTYEEHLRNIEKARSRP